MMKNKMITSQIDSFTPREIVKQLDRFIIGQTEAKKSVAVALRNRYRRSCLPEEVQDEITPKNIIMIGPTGVGKTEIARRLAKLVKAPFVKVEATKFTEIGYVGRDVESMVRDLCESAIRMIKHDELEIVIPKAEAAAEEKLLDILLNVKTKKSKTAFSLFQPTPVEDDDEEVENPEPKTDVNQTREKMRQRLRDGKLDKGTVEISVDDNSQTLGFLPGFGNDDMMMQLQSAMGSIFPKNSKKRKITVKEAKRILTQQEADKLIDQDQVVERAVTLTEQRGIIFIDEIDKIAGKQMGSGPDISREGVQRDILPIVEGTTVMTKHGPIKTDHVLFIAAGAFHIAKISDLIPELQGRFPIRVELKSLTEEDFVLILTQPENAIIKQQQALMSVEGLELNFTDDAIREIARMSWLINNTREDIGARRLHTIMEKLLEELSFAADQLDGQTIEVNAVYVKNMLKDLAGETDLEKYIL